MNPIMLTTGEIRFGTIFFCFLEKSLCNSVEQLTTVPVGEGGNMGAGSGVALRGSGAIQLQELAQKSLI